MLPRALLIMAPRPFKQWLVSATNNNKPIQSARTSFAPSDDPGENEINGPSRISARTCYALHGVLVMIHVVLVIFSISHWEHRVILPFTPTNNDFWSVVLSASLQAFYTIYTAILLFLTQRLAISRTLVRRLKLTSIHDISGAWSGLGSALSSVWQQIDIPASWWTTFAVAVYLACISVLHVTSSTLLQFQTFNATWSTFVLTALGCQYNLNTVSDLWSANWGTITASLPVVKQLPGLVSAGISNATMYDTLKTRPMAGTAIVNATTMTSHCGLLPNVTYFGDNGTANVPRSSGDVLMSVALPWSDQIQVRQISWPPNSQEIGVFLVVSTLMAVEASLQEEVSVQMTWEYENFIGGTDIVSLVPFPIEVYFVHCSLSSATVPAVVDLQNNSLRNPPPISQSSPQWGTYDWTSVSNDWQAMLGQVLGTSPASGITFSWESHTSDLSSYTYVPTIVDEYIMSLVGLNVTAQQLQFSRWAAPISTFVLSPDKLEAAVAQAAAQVIWIAGQLGTSNGGADMGDGMADAVLEITALRLNVNLLPLLFAAFASVIMLGLALYTTRAFHASHDTQAVIPNTGVLQLLWLGHHSPLVPEILEDVKYPTDTNLRRAGMVDVCFAKMISEEESQLSMRNSTDSLSAQIGHGHGSTESY